MAVGVAVEYESMVTNWESVSSQKEQAVMPKTINVMASICRMFLCPFLLFNCSAAFRRAAVVFFSLYDIRSDVYYVFG